MEYFEKFSSNTYAASGNQLYFGTAEGEVVTGRIFYKIAVSGEYDYSILFSNILDSTYSDGSVSHRNLVCDSWKIHGARIGKCIGEEANTKLCNMTVCDAGDNKNADFVVSDLKEISFNGSKTKDVMPAEFFCSDSIRLNFDKGDYLCLEISFSGHMIPYHEESQIPVFLKQGDSWTYSKLMPFAGMIGCNRNVKGKVGYLGDSITQGIGVAPNSYRHWNALLSQKIGEEYSFWNLGIGYGRGNDAATDGAWLYKAKQCDIIFLCFGVNDIYKGYTDKQTMADLDYIVTTLKKHGKKIILQTVPPFDYKDDYLEKWYNINDYIKNVLKEKVDVVFDVVPCLEGEKPGSAKFGGHPNENGCKIWAEELWKKVKFMFE